MSTVGIDIGGRSHAVARCRDRRDPGRPGGPAGRARTGPASPRSMPGSSASPSPVTLVTMESSGHYWMPLASHLAPARRPGGPRQPARGESTLPRAAWVARSPTRRMPGASPRWPCVTRPSVRDPLAGVELRQAARFAMTLVTEQAQGLPAPPSASSSSASRSSARCSTTRPAGPPGRCSASRPPRERRPAPADGHPRRRQRRARVIAASGTAKAERLQACRGRLDRGPRARRRGRLRGRPAARPVRPARAPDRGRRRARRERSSTASSPAGSRPSRASGPAICADAHRRDRRHRAVRRLRPAPRLCRRPPRRAQLGRKGVEPRDRLAHVQGRQRPPPGRRLPDGRRGHPATTRSSPPTTAASARPARAR